MTKKAESDVSTNIILGKNYVPFFSWQSKKREHEAVAFSAMINIAIRFFAFHFLMSLKYFPRTYHQEEEQKKVFSNLSFSVFVWVNVTRHFVIYGEYLHGDNKEHQKGFLGLK